MNRNDLIQRWNQGAGASAQTAIIHSLQKEQPPDKLSPFKSVGGRADFRGFSPATLRGVKRACLASIDFSFCNLKNVRITDCTFRNVEFSNGLMQELEDECNQYHDCHFRETRFRGSLFGIKRSVFNSCIFNRCDLAGLRFGIVEFNNCRFDNCELKGVDFGASSFVEVEFIGKLEDVWFRGRDPFVEFTEGVTAQPRTNEMSGVSFAKAELWDVTFSDNCRLSNVVLPMDGDHHYFDRWSERLKSALEIIHGWNDSRSHNFVAAYVSHAKKQTEYILNCKALIAELGTEKGKQVLETLTLI